MLFPCACLCATCMQCLNRSGQKRAWDFLEWELWMAMSSCKAETQGEIRDFLVTPHIFSIEGGSTSLAPDETVPPHCQGNLLLNSSRYHKAVQFKWQGRNRGLWRTACKSLRKPVMVHSVNLIQPRITWEEHLSERLSGSGWFVRVCFHC